MVLNQVARTAGLAATLYVSTTKVLEYPTSRQSRMQGRVSRMSSRLGDLQPFKPNFLDVEEA